MLIFASYNKKHYTKIMNGIKHLLLSGTNKLLAGLLSLLGFSLAACDKMSTEEYGCPHATFEIKGKVINEQGKAIPNIQVVIPDPFAEEEDYFVYRDTLTTNSGGIFNAQLGFPYFGRDAIFKVKTEDIDGEANSGLFEEKTTEVAFKESDLKGASGNWNQGSARKEVTITMKKEPGK